MTTVGRNDVVLVDVVFTGQDGVKRRPAVVISGAAFNNNGTKLIVAGVTSNLSPPIRPGDVSVRDWVAAGLMKPSAVRGVLATVDKSMVTRKLGALSSDDARQVEEGLKLLLELGAHL